MIFSFFFRLFFIFPLVLASQWRLDRLGVMCAQSAGWTSVHNMVHWSQLVRTQTVQMHDWGYTGNREHYGQGSPPPYDFGRWPSRVPVAIFHGGNDMLVSPRDAMKFE